MFSVGVILFYMLSGDLPFDHLLDQEVIQNILAGHFDFVGYEWTIASDDCKMFI